MVGGRAVPSQISLSNLSQISQSNLPSQISLSNLPSQISQSNIPLKSLSNLPVKSPQSNFPLKFLSQIAVSLIYQSMYLYIHSLIYAPLPLLTYAFLPFLPLPHPIPILPYPPLPYPLRLLQIPPNQRQRLYPSYTLLTYAFLLPYSTLPLSYPTPLGLSHPILSYSAPTLTLPHPTLLYPPPRLLQIPPHQRQHRWLRTVLRHAQHHRHLGGFHKRSSPGAVH